MKAFTHKNMNNHVKQNMTSMNKKNTPYHLYLLPLAAALSLTLSGCGGSLDNDITAGETLLTCDVPQVPNATGTECVAPEALICPFPTIPDALNESCIAGKNPDAPAPVFTPSANQAVLYYNRPDDGAYNGYRLHTWNDETCDSLAASSVAASWDNGLEQAGIDPNYGAYWVLDLKPDYDDCAHFIVHIGTDDAGKDLGGDKKMPLKQDDPEFTRMNFTFTKNTGIFEYPVVSLGEVELKIENSAAHLLSANELIWQLTGDDLTQTAQVKLHHSDYGLIKVNRQGVITGETIELSTASLQAETAALVPHISDWPAFTTDLTSDQAKTLLKNQLVAVAYNAEGKPIKATHVQTAKALDALYTMGDNDADEAQLGVHYQNGKIISSVWAPTAQQLTLKIFDADKTFIADYPMDFDTTTGIWTYEGDQALDRLFYQFEIVVYHPATQKRETTTATDPYSISLSTNGVYSQFVNLDDPDLKPADWDMDTAPIVNNPEDAVLLEGHIRDFSIRDQTVSQANRGKYLAFTETESDAVQYLKKMADNGATHFHMLPANDIATIQEDESLRIDLTSTVKDLCSRLNNLPECTQFADDTSLQSVLNAYDVTFEGIKAQSLVAAINNLDGFNWGYDPHHFNAPEGSYASNADGVTRIKEMRQMNKALHSLGYRVVLDVVYNHTAESGLNSKSVLDKLVPGYYHRYNPETGDMERSTCCENTATEHKMMDKFIVDSLVHWTQAYQFDSFRFDIMGHIPKSTILKARAAVQAIDPDNYFYGEGWNFGEVANDRLFEQAAQFQMAGTEVGTFNDRPRDYIRGEYDHEMVNGKVQLTTKKAGLFQNGFSNDGMDHIRLGLTGTLAEYPLRNASGRIVKGGSFPQDASYALDPADIINYVSKHDNPTLWDNLQYGLPADMPLSDRVRAHNIAATMPVMSQGIPFFQLGVDFMRSKSMDRDSYNAGDWFNHIDYTMQTNNWNIGLPSAEKNGDRWPIIRNLLSSISAPDMTDIQHSSAVFGEHLKIRQSSPLFRLTTTQEVIDRLGFHNIGGNQTTGLIVMSIDDGIGLTDLDPNNDAIVVVINATTESQTHSIKTASGFELHPILQTSADMTVQGASFVATDSEGAFTVPALTTAVFVKPQGDVQGEGLAALTTQGVGDIVPFGDTDVYLRGDMNGWSTDNPFTYAGNGVYQVSVELTENTVYTFKVADSEWGDLGVNYGGGVAINVNQTEDLIKSSSDNLSISVTRTGLYRFKFDANDTDLTQLTVIESAPYDNQKIFIRGSFTPDWAAQDEAIFIGNSQYVAAIELAAQNYQFKVADANWSDGTNFGTADGASGLTLDQATNLTGSNNISIDITEAGLYRFVIDATNPNAPSISVSQDTAPYAGAAVYLRGFNDQWDAVNQFTYYGLGYYAIDQTVTKNTQFKVADAGWETANYGVASAPTLDIPVMLTAGSNSPNTPLVDLAGRDIRFIFNVIDEANSQAEIKLVDITVPDTASNTTDD